jgi:hypothetical protein
MIRGAELSYLPEELHCWGEGAVREHEHFLYTRYRGHSEVRAQGEIPCWGRVACDPLDRRQALDWNEGEAKKEAGLWWRLGGGWD